MRPDVLELNPVPVHSLVRTRTRPLQGQGDTGFSLNGHPSQLYVPKEHHSVRSPILHRVGEDVDVHEGAPGLAGSELPKLSVGMAQTESGLSCVNTRTKELEFEDRLQCAQTRRDFGPGTKARLSDAEIRIAVGAELVLLGRELDGSYDVEPVRVHLLEVVTRIHHSETIDLQRRFGRLRL